jgi:hypothetical protein
MQVTLPATYPSQPGWHLNFFDPLSFKALCAEQKFHHLQVQSPGPLFLGSRKQFGLIVWKSEKKDVWLPATFLEHGDSACF